MKNISVIILSILFSSTLFAQNPACVKGDLTLTKKGKNLEWSLKSPSKFTQWLLIKNEDTKLLYPKLEIKKDKGIIYGADLEKNKNGYKAVIMEVSKEESALMREDLSSCAQNKDCSLKIKLNRCVIDEEPI